MSRAWLCLLLVALVGCRPPAPCPEPPELPAPVLRFEGLPEDASLREIVGALVADHWVLKAELQKRDAMLGAYRRGKR